MFIYFFSSVKILYCNSRENKCFCTECGVIGHWGTHWEERQKGNAYGIFVCNGFSFIGMVSGDWHKGRGVWGRGVFWKTKAGSHSWQKMERGRWGMRQFLFVCPGENLRSSFFPFISFFPPPTASCLLPHFFPFSSHYLTKLLIPPPQKIALWSVTVRDLHEHKQTQVNTSPHNPINRRLSCCVCFIQCRRSPCLCHRVWPCFFVCPSSPTPTLHLLSLSFLSCLSLLLFTRFFSHVPLQLSGSCSSPQAGY